MTKNNKYTNDVTTCSYRHEMNPVTGKFDITITSNDGIQIAYHDVGFVMTPKKANQYKHLAAEYFMKKRKGLVK